MRSIRDIMMADDSMRTLLRRRNAKEPKPAVWQKQIDVNVIWRGGGTVEECAAKAGMSVEDFRRALLASFRGVRRQPETDEVSK